ncbi:MAG: histidinol-phosphate transaminase [Proteobacteria bacterium]|nr:histidinol-phosphate transaminase [Pseudomonadota bacterium]
MPDDHPVLPYLRPTLQGLPRWNPTQVLPSESTGKIHRMDLNECPFPPSPKVVEAMRNMAENVNRYPDGGLPRLTARISENVGIPGSHICWGTGSSELLTNIIGMSVGPGAGLVAPDPIWRRFAGIFAANGADITRVPNKSDSTLDATGLVSAIGNNTRILVCVTPNNPTGLMLSADEVTYIASETPENVLLYVDEAYHEFAIKAGGPDALDILKQRKGPWVLTRTFSKAYALAGLRVGYAICSSDEIADALRAMTGTFNASAYAEAAALAALDDPDYREMILDNNERERERLIAGMAELGIAALPSVTNFVSAPTGRPAGPIAQGMRERGIRIATWPDEGYEDYIRVSVGLAEDTDAFLEALRDIFSSQS